MDYVEAAEARNLPGLRLALTVGVPGPWGESAKKIFEIKGIDFVPVAQYPNEANADLVAWTGIRNAPVAVYENEPGRSNFQDIVALAERLEPGEPKLIPEDAEERQLCFGISADLCGEGGFGWTRRIIMRDVPQELRNQVKERPGAVPPPRPNEHMALAYRSSEQEQRNARRHIAGILDRLAAILEQQRSRGSDYFVGSSVRACDVHWACFSALLAPLPAAVNPMPEWLRLPYSWLGPGLEEHKHPILLAHRDMMFARHLRLPLDY